MWVLHYFSSPSRKKLTKPCCGGRIHWKWKGEGKLSHESPLPWKKRLAGSPQRFKIEAAYWRAGGWELRAELSGPCCRHGHTQAFCLVGKDPGGSASPGVSGELGSLSTIFSYFKPGRNFKCLCFQKIMLKRDPQGFSRTPVLRAKLLRIRIWKYAVAGS